ncbi:MAG: NusG domain II-containing protein [bacterium]
MKRILRRIASEYLTLADRALILSLVLMSVLSSLAIKNFARAGSEVSISGWGKERVISLLRDGVITVEGALGDMKIEIKGGRARVIESNCPDKICIKQGWIANRGETIICVPNRVVIKVLGEPPLNPVDAISY